MLWPFATMYSMEDYVLSSDGSNCKFGRNEWEKSLERDFRVRKKPTKRSSYARSDGLKEVSKSNNGVAQYQHCIPSPTDEKDCYGGELYPEKEATNDVDCLDHESSDISWTLQQYTPLEFAAFSQALIDIDDLDQAVNMSPRSLIRSLQAQNSSPESESVRKQSPKEWGDTGYDNEYASPDSEWFWGDTGYDYEYASPDSEWRVRDNPIASLSPETVANGINNISDRRRRRNMSSTQEKLDDHASSSVCSSTVERIEYVSSHSSSSDIDLLLEFTNNQTEEELLINTMQLASNKQNPNPMVRCPKAKSTEADPDSEKEISSSSKFNGANSFCKILGGVCSFMKLIPRKLQWSLMCVPVTMAVIAIKICTMQDENYVLVPT